MDLKKEFMCFSPSQVLLFFLMFKLSHLWPESTSQVGSFWYSPPFTASLLSSMSKHPRLTLTELGHTTRKRPSLVGLYSLSAPYGQNPGLWCFFCGACLTQDWAQGGLQIPVACQGGITEDAAL